MEIFFWVNLESEILEVEKHWGKEVGPRGGG
jgi:hypothetical protein